jgi:plastocyanin
MGFTWRINIKKNPHPPGPAVFAFEETPQVQVGDQVFWSNGDTEPHWPASIVTVKDANGVTFKDKNGNDEIDKDKTATFFMDFKIAPNSTSSSFSPSQVGTITYFCQLHQGESGTIDVRVTPPPAGS